MPEYHQLTIRADTMDDVDGRSRSATIELVPAFDAGAVVTAGDTVIFDLSAEVELLSEGLTSVDLIANEDFNVESRYKIEVGARSGYFTMPARDVDLVEVLG